MKRILFAVGLMMVLSFSSTSFANELTHAIGNTGYMLIEAMWAHARDNDRYNYNRALRLQSEAKEYMRGTHPDGRHTKLAMEKTLEAYEFAKKARDNSLAKIGLKVSQ